MKTGSLAAFWRPIAKLLLASSLIIGVMVVVPTSSVHTAAATVKLTNSEQAIKRAKELNLLPEGATVTSSLDLNKEFWEIEYKLHNQRGEIWLSNETGELLKFYESNLDIIGEGKMKVTKEQAVQVAEAFIQQLPWKLEDTWIYNPYPISEYDKEKYGDRIRFDRAHNGIRFEGNFIDVSVNVLTGTVTSYTAYWGKETFETESSIMSYQAAAMKMYHEATPYWHWNENTLPKKLTYSLHDYYLLNQAGQFPEALNREMPVFTDKLKPQYPLELAKLRLLSNYELELNYINSGTGDLIKPYYQLRIKPGVPLFFQGDRPSIDANTGQWLDLINIPVIEPFPPASEWLIDAAVPPQSIKYKAAVVWNNELLELENEPLVHQGSTLLPFRELLEAMGAKVGWDSRTRVVTASKQGTTIEIPLYHDTIYINGKAQKSVPAVISKGRTYIPARVVLEAFGAKVSWNAESRLVLVSTKDDVPVLTALELKQLRFQAYIHWLEGSLQK
ncbi:copper amine oxidase N-terminal domain-containing protein [Paenibacillus sp. 1011MAR3C5]|uniref:copper amine oxidase N-terminal domain-containing protein n=1 Tax=Paenibacillus sp. 1011MAR3C5 TaxID=1675787 RepID=UPI000E6B88B2|nr:copper amine oxidase N-terminal domain-containing protein [Paenibacillus sp. 1011MAR3C5]RJE87044.1 copper amine oxidase N-terminal domain-containing protein [Paenibacillus sp. 1011MAR3C5]